MSKYKLRLKKDLPEYPKDCVFVLEEKGWRGYWEGGDWRLPHWLEALLDRNIPEISDDMHDFFEGIQDEQTTVYQVYMDGTIKERQTYNFWLNDSKHSTVFETREEAEQVAVKLMAIFAPKKAK